jgi:uncharacterized RDD family membrane protein YckC
MTEPHASDPTPAAASSAPPPAQPGDGATTPSGMPIWTAQLTSREATPGPAGLYYADVPNRIIALIIDAILLAIVSAVIGVVLYAIFGSPTTIDTIPDQTSPLGFRFETHTNFLATLITTIVGLAISAGYYIYMWTRMRGTIGQRALGMQVGNAADGATMTTEQAVRRWLALGGVFSLAQFLNPLPGIGLLIGLLSFVWVIALLVTTAQSPTKQGLHDQFANTIVVKAARSVG